MQPGSAAAPAATGWVPQTQPPPALLLRMLRLRRRRCQPATWPTPPTTPYHTGNEIVQDALDVMCELGASGDSPAPEVFSSILDQAGSPAAFAAAIASAAAAIRDTRLASVWEVRAPPGRRVVRACTASARAWLPAWLMRLLMITALLPFPRMHLAHSRPLTLPGPALHDALHGLVRPRDHR